MTRTLDNHEHALVMRWPARTCIDCAHQDCLRRRAERNLPCRVCGKRIEDGDPYRVITIDRGEIKTQIHYECERRKWDR